MKKLEIEVCVCAQCVMNGAMDIIEAIEGLNKLKTQLRFNSQIDIKTSTSLGNGKHKECSPVVTINGVLFERVNSETVMSKTISELRKL